MQSWVLLLAIFYIGKNEMHIPSSFKVNDNNEIYAFIESNAFGQIISNRQGRLLSSHIPFLLSEDKTKLIGHLAKINPQVDDINDSEVLVTLQGVHDYISPSWYAVAGVPTWNYQAVHIYGNCRIFSERESVKVVVDELTHKYESAFVKPWIPEYRAEMLGAIIGFEVEITDIQAQFKLSQNRSTQEREQVIEALETIGSNELANAMKSQF